MISTDWKETHAQILCDTYQKFYHEPLIIPKIGISLFDQLFQAPFILLSHGTQADPILNFGNHQALQLWEMNCEELCQTPSRLTAEPMEREARERFLQEVQEKGFVSHYEGIRISKTGKRFKITQTKVWNLVDAQNQYYGQAARFENPLKLPISYTIL